MAARAAAAGRCDLYHSALEVSCGSRTVRDRDDAGHRRPRGGSAASSARARSGRAGRGACGSSATRSAAGVTAGSPTSRRRSAARGAYGDEDALARRVLDLVAAGAAARLGPRRARHRRHVELELGHLVADRAQRHGRRGGRAAARRTRARLARAGSRSHAARRPPRVTLTRGPYDWPGMSIPAAIQDVHRRAVRRRHHALRRPARRHLQRHAEALAGGEPDRRPRRDPARRSSSASASASTRSAPSTTRSRRACGPTCASTGTTPTTSRRSTATSSCPPTSSCSTGPIWLGDQSSMTRKIIERLYAYSGELNDRGQWSYYGKVGGGDHHRQRGRRQARQRAAPLRAPAHRPDDPAAVRRLLGRRGRARARPTSTRTAAASGTPGPRATASSSRGTSCTSRGCSRTRAASPPTATPRPTGTSRSPSTRIPSTAASLRLEDPPQGVPDPSPAWS